MEDREPGVDALTLGVEVTLGPQGEDASATTAPAHWGARTLERGATIGRHVVLRKLGAGGMGVVYAAYDPELDRKVALKLLLPAASGVGGGKRRDRLLREAQALARLADPHVVSVHEVGVVDGAVYLAMEYVPGVDLQRWLAARPRGWREIADVMGQAGAGLRAAHRVGVIHSDFKPSNVLVGDDGRVRVADFGLATRRGADADQEGPPRTLLDAPAALAGTPVYMAPELFHGAPTTAQSDQYAFCVALYEALPAGRLCVVPGASHLVVLEQPRLVAQSIEDFLLGDEPPRTMLPVRRGRA